VHAPRAALAACPRHSSGYSGSKPLATKWWKNSPVTYSSNELMGNYNIPIRTQHLGCFLTRNCLVWFRWKWVV
jgi:hypothetical protein